MKDNNNKENRINRDNSFNLNDDLNKIINAKIEEQENEEIKNAINASQDNAAIEEINAKIDEQIDAQINAELNNNNKAEKKAEIANTDEEEKKKKRKNIIIIILIILLVVIGSVTLGKFIYDQTTADDDDAVISQIQQTTVAPTNKPVDNPYNFETLKGKNSDIYAWINVPNTKVDYPVVQSSGDDNFYLKKSAITKKYQASGAIYTQKINKLDFSDPVTVVYGHNGYKDTMFTTLHRFEKADFFNQNKYFYIYTNDAKLTYEIVSAFKFDDRHLLYAYNMQDLDARQSFFDMIQNPESQNKNVRNIGRKLTKDDKICVLSTCITNQKSNRYLVCGVLVKNEKTN